MRTRFGPQATEGDYVIVLDADYMHRTATTYIGRVHKNKAYTGETRRIRGEMKYIHKITAEVMIPSSIVPEETKLRIEEDIKIHNQPKCEV